MNARYAVIGAVAILSLGLFLLTLLFDGPDPRGGAEKERPRAVAPRWASDAELGGDQPVLGATRDFTADYLTASGQLVRIFADEFQPLPQGRAQAVKPRAHIYLAPHRVLSVRAERGRFDAPENQPRAGDFEGEVVLTLLEAPPGQKPDFTEATSNPHLKLRVFLDSVRFDLELGQIDSDQPLRIVAPRVEFRGVGLSMTYNELRKRIERLEVLQSGHLDIDRAALLETSRESKRDAAPPSGPEPPDAAAASPHQLYAVRCEREIMIETDAGTIAADRLDLLLTLEADERQILGAGGSTSPQSPMLPLPARFAALAMAQAEPAAVPGIERVRVRWTGRMVLTPVDDPPSDAPVVEVRQGAVFATLTGQPLVIRTPQRDRITAARLHFLSSTSRVDLVGNETIPLEIESPGKGIRIASRSITFDQDDGAATLEGAGSLRSFAPLSAEGVAGGESPLPLGLAITWTKKVDLLLAAREHREREDTNSRLFLNQLAGLERAAFVGDVKVRLPDPRVELDAQELEVPLAATDGEPARLRAIGQARLNIRDPRTNQALDLQADDLSLLLAGDAGGEFIPQALIADGRVVALDEQNTRLTANHLEVSFAPEAADEPAPEPVADLGAPDPQPARISDVPATGADRAPAEADWRSSRTRIANVVAEGEVRVEMPSQSISVAAHRLRAEPDKDLITLDGQSELAQVLHPDGRLSSMRIILQPEAQVIEAPGAGQSTFTTRTGEEANAGTLTVYWSRHMRFDQPAGMATFRGDVRTEALSGRDESHLTTTELDIAFSPRAMESSRPASTSGSADGGRVVDAVRAVRTIEARGEKTLFASQTWVDQPGGRLATRFRLGGSVLRFNQAEERLYVDGAGWMQIEDYRPAPADGEMNAVLPQVSFSGRGATLFEWTRGMTVDAAHNDVSMSGNVVMLHRPAEEADVMQLSADNLAADMQQTGGLDIWLRKNPPTPKLIAVRAGGADEVDRVRLISGTREVRTDKLTFLGADQSVLLESNPGRYTYIIDADRPTSYPAQAIRWDLRDKKITVLNPGAVRSAVGP